MDANLHNAQCIVFPWISLTLIQDFSSSCSLLFISNLNYTSNSIELCYKETRIETIKHPTLFKFLHTQFELFMQFLNDIFLVRITNNQMIILNGDVLNTGYY